MNDDWIETTLGDCCDFVSEKVSPTTVPLRTPYVGLEHIESNIGRISSAGTPSQVTSAVAQFHSGDTLFGRLRPYLHKVAYADFSGVCSPEVLILRARKDVIDAGFLFLAVSSSNAIDHAVALSAGSRMPRTSASDLSSFPISLPPLPVQRRIVDLMAHLDNHIANLRLERDAAEMVLVSVREEHLTGPVAALGDVLLDIHGGKSPMTDGVPPSIGEDGVLKVSAVTPGQFVPEESKRLPSGHGFPVRTEVRPNDVLITRANTPSRVGAVCLVPADVRRGLFLCDKTLRLVPNDAMITPAFLAETLNSLGARLHLTSSSTGTSKSMFNISHDKIRLTPISVPDLTSQDEAMRSIQSARLLVNSLTSEILALVSFRDSMLQVLLGGLSQIPDAYNSLLDGVA
jgi:type I restriction enzyme S subunit